MAIVRGMEQVRLERDAPHTEARATFSVIQNSNGEKFLQIDTYGSIKRQEKGKKSQSVRFSQEAIEQLRQIIQKL